MEDPKVTKWKFDPLAVKVEPRPVIYSLSDDSSCLFSPECYKNLYNRSRIGNPILRRVARWLGLK